MASFETAFAIVKGLVGDFKAGEKHYLSTTYQEAEVRKDFIDKFLIALGWDVHHNEQKNPYEQEVKVEPPVNVSGAQKRADFSFSLKPNYRDPKFFVEAKKPSQDLYNADYYFQTIRYGWHKATPIAALTDFEEFHILDCRFTPDITTVLKRQVRRFHYTDYLIEEKFAEIYWLFSREAVVNNSLEKFAEGLPKPRGKAVQKALFALEKHQTIDEDFLNEIEEKRETLAKAFKKSDESLTSEELTEATQRTIDRLVFIRFLEDKLIEQEHYVHEFGENGSSWNDFIALCRKLDAKYNGIVFKRGFIDDKKFKGPADSEFRNICQDLCHLNSRFLYNEIPIHILGSIYERFLGKVVHATDHRVKIEEKPEVRKAGGVYYTPKYIVDYIVRNTVGKLIEGKTPDQIAKLRFADIACGSGSFLIGVFDCVLDYHNKYYQLNPDKAKKDKCLFKDGLWVLSIKQKQNILRNNIYGVDIDSQAVEVTQLSLSLKMMEDETTATANEMMVLFHEKILPDMSKNIVCGNSLIGTDILKQDLFSGESEEGRKLNALDYESAFPEVMRSGGFDAVVGNPPYGALFSENELQHFKSNYKTSIWRGESYLLFIERALNVLKLNGLLGYIIPDTLINLGFTKSLREYLLRNSKLKEIVSLPSKIFSGATVDTILLFTEKKENIPSYHKALIDVKIFNKRTAITAINSPTRIIKANVKDWFEQNAFNLQTDGAEQSLLQKMEVNRKHIDDIAEMYSGIKSYEVGKGTPPQSEKVRDIKPFTAEEKKHDDWQPLYDGKHIGRYELLWKHNNWIKYGQWLAAPRNPENFIGEKILIRKIIGNTIIASYVSETSYCNTLLFVLKLKEKSYSYKCILGILNSSLIGWYFRKKFQISDEDTFPQIMVRDILQFPIPEINIQNKTEKNRHDNMVKLVDQMLEAKKKIQEVKTDKDKTYYERRCTELDAQIDDLVYELYGLTEEEIAIIEKQGNEN